MPFMCMVRDFNILKVYTQAVAIQPGDGKQRASHYACFRRHS